MMSLNVRESMFYLACHFANDEHCLTFYTTTRVALSVETQRKMLPLLMYITVLNMLQILTQTFIKNIVKQ